MGRERIRVTVVLEYDVDPDMYPDQNTPEERAGADLKNFEEDPEVLIPLIQEEKIVSLRVGSITTN